MGHLAAKSSLIDIIKALKFNRRAELPEDELIASENELSGDESGNCISPSKFWVGGKGIKLNSEVAST